DVLRLDEVDDQANDDGAHNRENGDRGVLTTNESHSALIDRAGDVAHRVGSGIPLQNVACQISGKQDGCQAGERDDPLDDRGEIRLSLETLPGLRSVVRAWQYTRNWSTR